MLGVRETPLGRLALVVVQVLAIGSASGPTLASGATVLEGATAATGLRGLHSEGIDACGPPNRARRAAGPLLRGTGYLKMTPVAPATLDASRTQQFLLTVRLPRAANDAGVTTIGALAVTTRCDPLRGSSRSCCCLPGYQWGDGHCKQLPACGGLFGAMVSLVTACDCLSFPAGKTGYCLPPLQASPASKTSTLPPKRLAPKEGDLSLSFKIGEGATDVELYLLRPEWNGDAKAVRNGTAVVLALNGSQAALRVSSLSPDWAGTYICRYRHGEALWELRQEVSVPLVAADFLPGLSRVSMDCSSHRPLTLQCCIWDRGGGGLLRAAWDPGAPAFVVPVGGNGGSLCHGLRLPSCPLEETLYRCTFKGEGLGSIQTSVQVTPIQAGDPFCPTEEEEEEEAGGRWGATKAGRVAELLCPEGREGKRLRSCSSGGTWGPIRDNCTRRQLRSELHQAQLLQAGLADPQTAVPTMLAALDGTLAKAEDTSPWDLLTVIATMDVLSQVALESHLRLEGSAVASFLSAANRMLSLEAEWSRAEALDPRAASGFLQAMENLTSLLVPSPGGFNLSLLNIELHSAQMGPDSVDDDYLKTFDTEPEVSFHIAEEELEALVRREGSITITSLVLKKMGEILPRSHGGATFILGSLVMSNAITSRNGSVTQVAVDMMFGHQNATNKTEDYAEGGEERVAQCVFWDHSLLEGLGDWSAEGCRTSSTKTGTNCTCHHLTSFSVLMSAGPVPTSPALTVLSKVGVSASILALVATLLTYYLVWPSVVKNKVSYFRYTTLVNIALSLLLASFWFLAASQLTASHENKLCVAAAFFTHFFYLATFFWMLVQALMLFHRLIFVFHQLTISSVTPAMVAVGYLCPLAIAAATVGATFPERSYVQEKLCWLSSRSKALYAFSVPVLAVVSVNLLILFVVLLKLMRPSVSEGSPGEERQALLGIFKALLVLTPVFGLTWGLGVITMTGQASQFAHYAFTVLNSFQGVFILIFGCLMDRKVRGALSKRFCKSPVVKTSTTQALPFI